MSETVKIRVLINRSKDRFRRSMSEPKYQIGDPLELALKIEVAPTGDGEHHPILERIWHELNVDNPTGYGNLEPTHIHVFHMSYPSLSVGDVVVIDGEAYSVESMGWNSLTLLQDPYLDTAPEGSIQGGI